MNASPIPVAVLYNAVEPHCVRPAEQLSELALETAAQQAAEALVTAGFAPRMIVLRENIELLVDELRRSPPAAVVNLCEGFRGASGYEADVAGLLELMDLPFTGNTAETLALCRDKFRTKAVLSACGLTVPAGFLAEGAHAWPAAPAFPLIVKPNSEDAGIGIYTKSVVRDATMLRERVNEICAVYAQPALVEEFIEGREINVAVVQEETWRVLPFSEIYFEGFAAHMPKIVGYEAKWQAEHPACRGTVPVCPASVSAALAGQLEAAARNVCRILRLRGYARLDFRVNQDETALLLEVNPNPDTSRDAGLARSLKVAGISYEHFWRGQIELALRGKKEKK